MNLERFTTMLAMEAPPIGFLIDTVAFAAVPALLVGAWFARDPEGNGRRHALLTGAAVLAGFVVALWRHDGAPVIPPATAQQWLPGIALGGFAMGAVLDFVFGWSISKKAHKAGQRRPNAFVFALPALVALTCTSMAAVYSYTGRMGSIVGSLATAIGILLAVHMVRRNQRFGYAARLVFLPVAVWVVYILWKYNDMVDAAAPLLIVSLLAAAIPRFAAERRGIALKSIIIRTLLAAATGGIAVYLTYRVYEPYVY